MYLPQEARPLAEVTTDLVVDLLRRAKALITRREDWCPNGWGKGGQRCAVHALAWADRQEYSAEQEAALNALAHVARVNVYDLGVAGAIGNYNDSHTHAEVLAKFDEAIALAEGRR